MTWTANFFGHVGSSKLQFFSWDEGDNFWRPRPTWKFEDLQFQALEIAKAALCREHFHPQRVVPGVSATIAMNSHRVSSQGAPSRNILVLDLMSNWVKSKHLGNVPTSDFALGVCCQGPCRALACSSLQIRCLFYRVAQLLILCDSVPIPNRTRTPQNPRSLFKR